MFLGFQVVTIGGFVTVLLMSPCMKLETAFWHWPVLIAWSYISGRLIGYGLQYESHR